MSQKEFEGLVFAAQIPVKGKFNDSQAGIMTYNQGVCHVCLSIRYCDSELHPNELLRVDVLSHFSDLSFAFCIGQHVGVVTDSRTGT